MLKKLKKSFDVTMPVVSKTFKRVLAFRHTFLTDFCVLTHLKAFCIGMDLNTCLSALTKPCMPLNELLLESERSELKRYVLGHLIQPISWRGLTLSVIPLMYLSSLHLEDSKGGRY